MLHLMSLIYRSLSLNYLLFVVEVAVTFLEGKRQVCTGMFHRYYGTLISMVT